MTGICHCRSRSLTYSCRIVVTGIFRVACPAPHEASCAAAARGARICLVLSFSNKLASFTGRQTFGQDTHAKKFGFSISSSGGFSARIHTCITCCFYSACVSICLSLTTHLPNTKPNEKSAIYLNTYRC